MTIAGKTETREKAPAGRASAGYPAGASPYSIRIAELVSQRKLAAHRISELTKRATAALDRPLVPDTGARPDRDDALMTIRQVAVLLKIDLDTVGLWNQMGILKQVPSPQGDRRFRRADILTFTAGYRGKARDRGLPDNA